MLIVGREQELGAIETTGDDSDDLVGVGGRHLALLARFFVGAVVK